MNCKREHKVLHSYLIRWMRLSIKEAQDSVSWGRKERKRSRKMMSFGMNSDNILLLLHHYKIQLFNLYNRTLIEPHSIESNNKIENHEYSNTKPACICHFHSDNKSSLMVLARTHCFLNWTKFQFSDQWTW